MLQNILSLYTGIRRAAHSVCFSCSSLTYNAKEIRMLLKEESDELSKWLVEWIIIDPASFTGTHHHLPPLQQ